MKSTILSLLALCLTTTFCFAQTDFYYSFDYKKVPVNISANKYLVQINEELNGIENTLLGEPIYQNYYLVNSLVTPTSLGLNFLSSPVYNTGGEGELYALNEVLLKFKTQLQPLEKNTFLNQFGLTHMKTTGIYEMYSCNFPLKTSRLIYETDLVEYCHPNFISTSAGPCHIPNDEFFDKQFYLHNTGQQINEHAGTKDADIDAPEAWEITKGDPNIVIAVLDEGFTTNHPDLPATRQLILPGCNFDDLDADRDNPFPALEIGTGNPKNHGNACAGIIAATQDNNKGVSGIAPNCKIMPIKIRINGPINFIADAIEFAYLNNADIISNSWAFRAEIKDEGEIPVKYAVFVDAIEEAIARGSVVVFAAGNPGKEGIVQIPANADIDELITVGASDRNNKQANYSPTDKNSTIDIVAPSHTAYNINVKTEAVNVWTIDVPGNGGYNPWVEPGQNPNEINIPEHGEELPDASQYGNHLDYTGRMGGTSAAGPQVAGVAALMQSVNSCIGVKHVKDLLLRTADKVGNYEYTNENSFGCYSYELGHGKLNAYKAVKAAQDFYSPTLDLFIHDTKNDIGNDAGYPWTWDFDNSPDIWVRQYADGFENQEMQDVDPSTISFYSDEPVYVYVRIGNKSCVPSLGSEKLGLYWSRASTMSSWPQNWDGTNPNIGNLIDRIKIPKLQPGEEIILEIPWHLNHPDDLGPLIDIVEWHSCLLARIENSNEDPITVHPGALQHDVYYNNNVPCVI